MAVARKSKATEKVITNEQTAETPERSTAFVKPSDVDPHQIITVKNGFNGILVYISSKTGEKFVWDSFGAEQEMELGEIRNAKNSAKAFFINNWFMFDEEYQWVIDYVGARMYYKNAVSLDNIDEIFGLEPDEIKARIESMTAGQKQTLAYMAREKKANKEIDSYKVVAALENALGIKLSEE